MKKNKMMRLACILLVCVMLSTSVISGTFAKYTTQDSASDSARVAKWGVELQVAGNLFGDAYTNAGAITAGDTFTVKSFTSTDGVLDDVVAPGTMNEAGFSFSLNGQPEVDGKIVSEVKYQNIFLKEGTYGVMVKVADGVVTPENFQEFSNLYTLSGTTFTAADKNSANFYTLEDDINLTHAYYPVEFAMSGTDTQYNVDYTAAGLETNSLQTIVNYITAADHLGTAASSYADGVTTIKCERSFETNENLDSFVKLGNQKITWKWDFCQNNPECDNGNSACPYCKVDTILGMLKNTTENVAYVVKATTAGDYSSFTSTLVEFEDYCLDVEFSIDITVTQED